MSVRAPTKFDLAAFVNCLLRTGHSWVISQTYSGYLTCRECGRRKKLR
ncbi:hypothetical protein ACMGDH_11325 [Sphingomonas sp. DT-207]